jgi:hypothetical protein
MQRNIHFRPLAKLGKTSFSLTFGWRQQVILVEIPKMDFAIVLGIIS